MKNVKLVLAVLVLVAGVPFLSGHGAEPQKEPDQVSALMRRKLQHAQQVLEGIALNDFNKIAKEADELIFLSREAEWKVVKTPQYELRSNEFRRAAEALVRNAVGKNLDGAAFAYVDLTLTCVKCHQYVREVRMARR
jgi:hypothetical protein